MFLNLRLDQIPAFKIVACGKKKSGLNIKDSCERKLRTKLHALYRANRRSFVADSLSTRFRMYLNR